MKPISPTPELLNVARRVVWFKKPEQAFADPIHFLAYVMTYGTIEDLVAVGATIGKTEYREVLENAPAGVFDPRSWAYWNIVCGFDPQLPMPSRLGRIMQPPPAR
jgi:hypothetical protein